MGVEMTRAARVRGDVHLVRLDPTLGSEIQKTRPCLVVSTDERWYQPRPKAVGCMP